MPLRALAEKYAPDDPIAPIAHLFDTLALDETGDLVPSSLRRAEAFRALYDNYGARSVLRLAAEARVPYLVVEAASGAGLSQHEIEELLLLSFREDPTSALTVGLSGVHRIFLG